MQKRLPGLLVNSYGFAYLAFTLMMSLALNYYTYFLTEVAMISAAYATLIIFITHFVDIPSILLSGAIIQKTRFRWGQFRSWLLIPPVFTCIFFTLTFTNLSLDYSLKMIYLSLVYTIAHVILNLPFNAHLGLISVLSTDVDERLRLSTRNIQIGMLSTIIYSMLVVKYMLPYFSRQSESWGFFYTVLILGVVQILGYWNLFYLTKDYDEHNPGKKLNAYSNLTLLDLLNVLKNKHLLRLMVADCGINLGIFSLQTLAIFYFKYITGDKGFMAWYLLALGFATWLSALIAPGIAKIFGKKGTYLFAGAWGAVGFTLLRFFGASNPYIYTTIVLVSVLGSGTSYAIKQAMYMDAAEYGFYKSGKDGSAFLMSMVSLPVKISVWLATTIAAGSLALIGYEANQAVTEAFKNSLMNIICFVPVACALITIAVMSFYSLSDKKLTVYMEANARKRAGAKT